MGTKRPIRVEGDFAVVPLTRGYEAVIDASDIPLADGHNWTALVCAGKVYAYRQVSTPKPGTMVYLHRLIFCAGAGQIVDHIDGDSLNNRRGNLRFASTAENIRNSKLNINSSSGFKGVAWHKNAGKWVAYITKDRRRIHLGIFSDKAEAVASATKAREDLHGAFARHL